MIKLFIQNKFTEIVNQLYRWWNEDMPSRYIAILCARIIPGTILGYFLLMTFEPDAVNHSTGTVLFFGGAYYFFTLCAIGFCHLVLYFLVKWIKDNIQLAKKGIKVKAEWKDGV